MRTIGTMNQTNGCTCSDQIGIDLLLGTIHRDWIELGLGWIRFDWIEFDFVCAKQRAISVWPLTERESNNITHLCANQI